MRYTTASIFLLLLASPHVSFSCNKYELLEIYKKRDIVEKKNEAIKIALKLFFKTSFIKIK